MRTTGPVADSFLARLDAEEASRLSPLAVRSSQTRGRLVEEVPCGLRSPFQRDRDRIVHSKAFRRLKHKTQVFVAPEGDHYRTRLTHTLEVGRDLAYRRPRAAPQRGSHGGHRLGHDLGHPPFGHAGEAALVDGARGSASSAVPPQRALAARRRRARARRPRAESDARGARRHPQSHGPDRARVARGADRQARRPRRVHQPRHRRRDARRRARRRRDLPEARSRCSARRGSARIDAIVHDLVETSDAAGDIRQSEPIAEAMLALRAFLFARRLRAGPAARGGRPRGRSSCAACSATSASTRRTWATTIPRSTSPHA